MDIKEASEFFESLRTKTDKKSEIKVYETFIGILSALKNRKLMEGQIQSIEKELDKLELRANPQNRKKYFALKLTHFKKYLKVNFSLIPSGYYTEICISLGTAIGVAFGLLFEKAFERSLGIVYGITFGLIIGQFVGRYMDNEAEKQNRVLKTEIQ